MKIGMVGFRGIPSSYSGSEEFVLHLAPLLAARGHEVIVYCRSGLYADRDPNWRGVRRVFLPTIEHKSLGQLIHAGLAMLAALRDGVDVVFVMSLPSAPHTLLAWLFRRPIAINVDGLEWLRDKWGTIAKAYYRFARDVALFTATTIVTDSQVLRAYYLERHRRDSTFIAYGSELEYSTEPARLVQWGITAGGYFLVISRLVPENNVDMIIAAYLRADSSMPLVIAGSANYESPWVAQLLAKAGDRVRFIGHVDDRRDLIELQCNCFAYVHGHSVGGTNPSLVRALGSGNCIVAYATPYNREVLTGVDGSMYGELFGDEDELVSALAGLEAEPATAERLRASARARVAEAYTWESIADRYEEMFRGLIAGGP